MKRKRGCIPEEEFSIPTTNKMTNTIQEDNFSPSPVHTEENAVKDLECQTDMSSADINIEIKELIGKYYFWQRSFL